MRERLRIFYAAGPGNVIGTYRHWKQRQDDPSQLAMTYSGQFYQVVEELGAQAFVVASCGMRDKVCDEQFHIEHWPIPFEENAGPLYHLGQLVYGLRLLIAAVWFRADVAVVCGGTHWFVLSMMSMLGIRVVPSLHCMLWRTGVNRGHYGFAWVRRVLRKWDGWFFCRHATAILSVSAQLTEQVRSLQTSSDPHPLPPIHTFTPIYRRGTFDQITPAPQSRHPFKILYIGRIERNKGVFDLLSVASRLTNEGHGDIAFDLCGTGNAMTELQQQVAAAGLGDHFHLHGHCNQLQLSGFLSGCHVVIAPTQQDFLEGFNKVVIEGVLARRPVITSSICPSLALVRDAAVEVAPDDVQGYGDAIIRLRDDRELYARLVANAAAVSPLFYDESVSWGETLANVLRSIQPASAPANPSVLKFGRLSASHSTNSFPARISFAGMLAAVALGVLATLLGIAGGERPGKVSSATVSTKTASTPVSLGTSLAMHPSAGHSDQASLIGEP